MLDKIFERDLDYLRCGYRLYRVNMGRADSSHYKLSNKIKARDFFSRRGKNKNKGHENI